MFSPIAIKTWSSAVKMLPQDGNMMQADRRHCFFVAFRQSSKRIQQWSRTWQHLRVQGFTHNTIQANHYSINNFKRSQSLLLTSSESLFSKVQRDCQFILYPFFSAPAASDKLLVLFIWLVDNSIHWSCDEPVKFGSSSSDLCQSNYSTVISQVKVKSFFPVTCLSKI